jgi:serralysin
MDYVYGEVGDDSLDGGSGEDHIFGDIGNDVILGGDGIDYLRGDAGADALFGGADSDFLHGDDGDDILDGGTGSDTLYGGSGNDTVIWHLPRASYTTYRPSGTYYYVYDGKDSDLISDQSIEKFRFTDGTFFTSTGSTAAQVYRLYGATLGRAPDPSGLKNWVSAIDTGALTLKQVVSGFTGSQEFLMKYDSPDNTAFVTLLYKNVLGRAPDPSGLSSWTNALAKGMSRSDVVLGFSESAEDIERTRSAVEKGLWLRDDQAAQIARLYHATLNRLPDAGGLEGWTSALKSGQSLLQISDGFTGSAEFQQKYGSLNNTSFLTLLYNNVLGRNPDDTGLTNWVDALNTGKTRAEVVVGFSESSEHQAQRASYIDDGIKLYGSNSALAGMSLADTTSDDAALSSFVDRVTQLGLLDRTTLSAATNLTSGSLTERLDSFGILAIAA